MSAPLRILMVEDSADDAQLIIRELERGGYIQDHTEARFTHTCCPDCAQRLYLIPPEPLVLLNQS
jgi:hypothetical protein